LVLAIAAAITVTLRTVSRIESINAASRAMQSGLGERVETTDGHGFKSNRRQECAQMLRKNGQLGPQTQSGMKMQEEVEIAAFQQHLKNFITGERGNVASQLPDLGTRWEATRHPGPRSADVRLVHDFVS
jgi:hypothetical protein